ncbi:motile sperm domain-containing protein 2-like isoform X2 [Oratosquilla oratoria]
MSTPPPEPSKAEIDQLRSAALQKIECEEQDKFDATDVQRISTDDKYVRRFLMHHDNDQKFALDMVMDTLKWRKEMGASSIDVNSIEPSFFEKGALFVHGKDKDNCKMLIFTVSQHQKGVLDMDMLKKFLIYWLERLERETKGEWITVFFDMRDTGMKNMDMDFIQYMINLFKNHYPWFLNYIIVFEMPWLLNAMWRIIKTWLPPKSVEKIKFVDKKNIGDYVTKDQSLVAWGGDDAYEYKFEPEEKGDVTNGDIEARKVHFADGGSSPPDSPAKIKATMKRAGSSGANSLIHIVPSEELVFSSCNIGASANIVVSNPDSAPIAFKIKTTSPDKYRVKPSVGVLGAEEKQEIFVSVSEHLTPATIVRDKFLVMATKTTTLQMSSQDLSQLFKAVNKEEVYETRMKVGIAATDVTESQLSSQPTAKPVPDLAAKMDHLIQRVTSIEDQLRSARRLVFIALVIMVAVLCFLVMASNNATNAVLMQAQQHFNEMAAISAQKTSTVELKPQEEL